LSNPAGTPTTLFRAIRDDRFSLLLFSDGSGAVPQLLKTAEESKQAFPDVLSPHLILRAGDSSPVVSDLPIWLDAEKQVHQRLGVTGPALVLVRPDGYIGYRCQPANPAKLSSYLGRVLVRRG
jgi:hypothetical protein